MAAGAVAMSTDHLALARLGAEALLREQTHTTMGLRFPSVEDAEKQDKYGSSLYDGAAGVGLVLLDLWRATGDRRFRRLEDRVQYGIIESTPTAGELDLGLFAGHSGTALHHLARAHLLRDRAAFTYALDVGERLARAPLAEIDLIIGAAGAGLVQLALYHASGEPVFLEGARRIVAFLGETAVVERDVGAQWPSLDRRSPVPKNTSPDYAENAHRLFTGLAHGTAGVLVFLLEYVASTNDRDALHLAEQGFQSLDRLAVPFWDGFGWPRSDNDSGLQGHWCHGSAGIAHAYLALHRVTGDANALTRATLAAKAAWSAASARNEEPSCHCHGLSGAVELFVAIAQVTGNAEWRERAQEAAARIAGSAETSLFPGVRGAGLSVGTAGVVRELLRLTGHRVFPIMQPLRERLRLASPRGRARSSQGGQPPTTHLDDAANCELAELLPPVAAPLEGNEKWLVLGQPNEAGIRQIVKALSARQTGPTFQRAVERVRAACADLTREYDAILAPNALTPASFGKLLREIAGMCLSDDVDPRRIDVTARRITSHTIDAVALMLHRLRLDLRRNGRLRPEVTGQLEAVGIVGGDSHRRGQRVVSLRFADGTELLYKAHSLAVDRELSGASAPGEAPTLVELCNGWLTPRIAGARLPTHQVIDAGDWHGYAERVSPAPASTVELEPSIDVELPVTELGYALPLPRVAALEAGDDRRFWYSAGLLAGFAYCLGAHDLHAENVLVGSSRSSPSLSTHIVDGELAFGRVDGLSDTQLLPPLAATTGYVQGKGGHDHCGLTMSLDYQCAMFAEDWNLELSADGVKPAARAHHGVSWTFPHVVRNADGSFGVREHLCVFLRGVADVWDVLRQRSDDVATHLKAVLTGRPGRVLRKATGTYWAALEQRRMGGPPVPGRAHVTRRFASRLDDADLRQLDALDFPYYVRILGEEEDGSAGVWWTPGKRRQLVAASSLGELSAPPPLPFWSIVQRQSDPALFTRAITDAVLYAAPDGPFDLYDKSLGVRVLRAPDDSRIVAALLLGSERRQRLTCRMMPDTGAAEFWLE